MIQVAAFILVAPAGHGLRVRIEIAMGNPPPDDLLADDLTAIGTAARFVGHDWNRNSEAEPLKSSALYIACDLADVAVVV